ncbi:MAG: RNA methyltransferase [Demequinaceae bacterium]|nr:RNA methyltransferase [Demequinaceae bacterium]
MTERPVGRHFSPVLANVRADRVREVAALAGRSARRRASQFLVEGPQAVRELVAFRAEHVRDVYVVEDALAGGGPLGEIAESALAAGLHVHPMTSEVAHAMSPDCQGIVAVAQTGAIETSLPEASPRLVAILSQVRDPGNAGAVIRVADAAGADAVILAGDSVDPTNPKVVRATTGSLFHLPVIRAGSLADAVELVREAGMVVVASDVSGTSELGREGATDLDGPTAWVFGNEAWGLSGEELALADSVVRIPIFGHAESLNLGTAAAVCLYASAQAQRR